MKKVLVLCSFLLFTLVTTAQSTYKQEVVKLMKIQSGAQFDLMIKQFENVVPAGKKAAFKKEVGAKMDELYTKLSKIYMEAYTKEDVEKILDFYSTPIGKKIQQKTPELMQKSMKIGQSWGKQLQPILTKYMQGQ